MSNENDELFAKIYDLLNPYKTEEETRRNLYRNIARKILISLGYEETITRVDHALQQKDSFGFKKILEKTGQNPENFSQQIIESAVKVIADIPDQRAVMQLLRTAISGIPLKSEDITDTVIELPIASPSDTSTVTDINPYGQSKTNPQPNKKGTEKLLKALLKETGFATSEEFNKLKVLLDRSSHFNQPHPSNNNLILSVDKPSEVKRPQTSSSWAYHIKITHNKA